MAEQDAPQTLMEGALAAIGGFLWLGNNLHHIKASPDEFRRLYEAALTDAQPIYDRIKELIDRQGER